MLNKKFSVYVLALMMLASSVLAWGASRSISGQQVTITVDTSGLTNYVIDENVPCSATIIPVAGCFFQYYSSTGKVGAVCDETKPTQLKYSLSCSSGSINGQIAHSGTSKTITGQTTLGQCQSSCSGKVCGNDGCDGSCGSCNSGFSCNGAGQCVGSGCVESCGDWISTGIADTSLTGGFARIVCTNFDKVCKSQKLYLNFVGTGSDANTKTVDASNNCCRAQGTALTGSNGQSYCEFPTSFGGWNTCISGTSCSSVWTCGSWGTCIGGQKTRTCTDASGCSTPSPVNPNPTTETCTFGCTSNRPTNTCGTDNCNITYNSCSSGNTCSNKVCVASSSDDDDDVCPGKSGITDAVANSIAKGDVPTAAECSKASGYVTLGIFGVIFLVAISLIT